MYPCVVIAATCKLDRTSYHVSRRTVIIFGSLFSLGTVGYIGTSYFVKKIYSTVKID